MNTREQARARSEPGGARCAAEGPGGEAVPRGGDEGRSRRGGRVAGPQLDHVAIAVRSFDDVLPLLERLGGAEATRPQRVESQGVELCFVGDVEVIRPLSDDNGVARFIERRGPGLHHVAYRVPDLGKSMDGLRAEGYVFTSDEPLAGAGGHRIAFMHPRAAGGLLVELVERG